MQPVSVGFGGGNTSGPIEMAACLTAKGQRVDFEVETFVAETARTLLGKGNDSLAHDLDTYIAHTLTGNGNDATNNLSPTLRSMGHNASHANGGGQMAVAFAQNQRDEVRQMDIAGALAAEPGMKQQTYINQGWMVRRLTVRECERLQGFPDGFTLIETGKRRTVDADMGAYLADQGAIVTNGNDGKIRTNAAADGPRYKALGNSWAVPCGAWILGRMTRLARSAQ